jgi:hypothetical protein
MVSFVALYRGATVGEAKMVAVSANPQIVAQVATQLLAEPQYAEKTEEDPVLQPMNKGRRQALRLIQKEARE